MTIVRFPPGVCSTDITPRLCASLIAARTLALPMLARAAICATGKEHLPDVWTSFRMTASTAIASVFRRSATSGGTITVEARNLRPHTRRMVGRCPPPLSRSLIGRAAEGSPCVDDRDPEGSRARNPARAGNGDRSLAPSAWGLCVRIAGSGPPRRSATKISGQLLGRDRAAAGHQAKTAHRAGFRPRVRRGGARQPRAIR